MNEKQALKAVVFAGDYAYIRQIETALKSLCYHNSHLKIYLFNQDIPKEWFKAMRAHVETLGGQLIDIKILADFVQLNWFNRLEHINHMTFARYYIPDYVAEDKVLYLDSDLIVTGNIDPLFAHDLGDNYAGVVESCFGAGVGFNAGVLLINNKLWKEEGVRQQLVETTEQEHTNVNEGDQSIFNLLFAGRVLMMDWTYNFQIGFDQGAADKNHHYIFEIPLEPLPLILHYISPDKPWITHSTVRLREVWWRYHLMEWSTILSHWQELGVAEPLKTKEPVLTCLNLTNSYMVEQVEYLIQALPQVEFIIAAYTFMAGDLMRLGAYPNVTLLPSEFPLLMEQVVKSEVDLYLDINHHDKLTDIYTWLEQYQIPSLAFDNTVHSGTAYQGIYDHTAPEQMVAAIRQYMEEEQ